LICFPQVSQTQRTLKILRTLKALGDGYQQRFWKYRIGQNIRSRNYWINYKVFDTYVVNGIFPALDDWFEVCLFNTFRSYLPKEHFPVKYNKHSDQRGIYVETMKFNSKGQVSFSTTLPGITRGNHFHTRKVERFAVIQGNASIKLRKYGTDEVIEYILNGDEPAYVDIPIWYTHNITNIGDNELLTMFWINEFYEPDDPDTYYEPV